MVDVAVSGVASDVFGNDPPRLRPALDDLESARRACADFRRVYERLRAEIAKVIVGQDQVVHETLLALFADGHVLFEGVPGLGKTLLVSSLGRALSLPYARIQFTPDVMPADITGTNVVVDDPSSGQRRFEFRAGPIFRQLILADEINRATPKSQAALLEAMQERSVSVGGTTHHLERPFLVMATQNPIEQEGTYALPEAQLDRFLLKVRVPFTTQSELNEIIRRTTRDLGDGGLQPVLDGARILDAQALARRIVVAPHVQDYCIRLVLATHPASEFQPPGIARYVLTGVSPRGAQAIISTAKVRALVDGRYAVGFKDVAEVALPALRHRIIRSFEAEAEGVSTDDIVSLLLERLPRDELPA